MFELIDKQWNYSKLVTNYIVHSHLYVCSLANLAFRNPVGVITLGCTCEVQEPSHLLTLTSLLHVRCRRPRSSNSSKNKIKIFYLWLCISVISVLQSACCVLQTIMLAVFAERWYEVWILENMDDPLLMLCGNQIIKCFCWILRQ